MKNERPIRVGDVVKPIEWIDPDTKRVHYGRPFVVAAITRGEDGVAYRDHTGAGASHVVLLTPWSRPRTTA